MPNTCSFEIISELLGIAFIRRGRTPVDWVETIAELVGRSEFPFTDDRPDDDGS